MAEAPLSDDEYAPVFTTEQIDQIVANRAAIEQAKGILMSVYGIDSEHAFHLLRAGSRDSQVKLRLLAAQVVKDVVALTPQQRLDMPAACENLLLTAHKRIRRSADDS